MRFIIAICCLLPFSGLRSQEDTSRVILQLGTGLGIYNANHSYNLNSGLGAAALESNLSGHYMLKPRFSLGLSLGTKGYITEDRERTISDSSSVVTFSVVGITAQLHSRYYWAYKPKFHFYSDIGYGYSQINLNAQDLSTLENVYLELTGFATNLGIGINWFILKRWGINWVLNYANHHLVFRYMEVNGDSREQLYNIETEESRLTHRGLETRLSLIFKI